MTNITEVPNYPGSAKIEEVWHDNGTMKNDITLFVLRIDIHSDVNIASHQCDLQIGDYENLMEKFQFTAGDAVWFTITENGASFERRYKIKKINEIVNTENGRLYRLKLISEFEYTSIHTKISRYYNGPTHEIAKAILDNYTREGINIWEESKAQVEVIIPYWSPLKAVKWLGKKARAQQAEASFMFFQDSKQFWNFTSLTNLRTIYSKAPLTLRYFQNTTSTNGIPNVDAIRTTIQSLKYYDAFDIKKEVDSGNMVNTDFVHDFTKKSFEIWKYGYHDTYAKNALNTHKLWKQEEYGFGKIGRYHRFQSTSEILEHSLPFDAVDEELGYSRGQQIEITMYGNNDVDIGQILNIEIPSPEPKKTGQATEIDKTWSGLYYVVAKHDAYDRTGHTMALRLAKDSFI